jgi:glutathione S-transferase
MITLYQFQRAFGLPNPSPFCMKVETYLRLAKLDYEHATLENPGKAPKKQCPYIVDGSRTIADSALILRYLQDTYGNPLAEGLDLQTRAHHYAIERMCEEHLYFALVHERWTRPENSHFIRDAFFGKLPGPMRTLVFKMVQRQIRRRLWSQGMGRHTQVDIETLALGDIQALSDILGEASYFGGDMPRQVDCITLGMLANVICGPGSGRIKDETAALDNLVAYTDRMLREVFPDFADSAKA